MMDKDGGNEWREMGSIEAEEFIGHYWWRFHVCINTQQSDDVRGSPLCTNHFPNLQSFSGRRLLFKP